MMTKSARSELRRAKARYANATAALKKIQLSDGLGQPSAAALHQLLRSVPTGLYWHFKGTEQSQKFYLVFGVIPGVDGLHPPVVAYCALYKPHAGELVNRVMLGHTDAFLYPIERPNDPKHPYIGLRFKLVRNLTWKDATRLRRYAKQLARCKHRKKFLERFDEMKEYPLIYR